MVLTGDLADMIGSDDAVELLAMVKNAIAEYHLDDYDSLRPYVEQGAKQLGVQLTEDQIDQITKLGVQIAKLDLDPEKLAGQLNGLVDNIRENPESSAVRRQYLHQHQDRRAGFLQLDRQLV